MKNIKQLGLAVFIIVLIVTTNLLSQEHRILLDEIYTDWDAISGVVDTGDAVSGTNFLQLKVTNYEDYFFLFLQIDEEINLQSDNLIRLYIDNDNDTTTGVGVNNIGADIVYTFGKRRGRFYYNGTSTTIYHDDIGLVSLPTVTSNVFEIQLKKNSIVHGQPLFPNDTIKIVIENLVTDGDLIPNNSGGYEFVFSALEPQHNISYSIKKINTDNLRIVSYNVERDQFFDADRKEAHRRIFRALDPDIIGFQEIYNHTAQEVADIIEEFLPSLDGEEWHTAKEGPDIIVVSRFPITRSFAIDNNGAFILDLKQYQRNLLFVNAHTPSGGKNDSRQKEIDNFMAFIRDAKEEGGVLTLAKNSPIVIVGDMNLVGFKEQQTTLITGEIVNNNLYGESFMPDWDSTYFADAKPVTTNMPSTFTWYNASSSYSPGRLDYVVYSNSVMNTTNSFVLFTNALPEDSLSLYNLQSNDVTSVADHLPTVVDFKLLPKVSLSVNSNLDYSFSLSQNYPNPFNPSTVIRYEIGETDFVTLKIYNSLGQEIKTLVNKEQNAGNYEVKFNASINSATASHLASGIYFYKLSSGGNMISKKMLLLK